MAESANAAAALPLQGVRVLDVSQVMAGPFCSMLLGDMGADVIKIEPPDGGDQTRRAMGFKLKGNDSLGFFNLNRNKRSLALNLKSKTARDVFYRLTETADILLENYRPGVTQRLGIDYPTLAKINPRLIYASISGFGQTGPWSQRPGFDLIAQAMAGVMSITGQPDGPPTKAGVPVSDIGCALFALYGILSAFIGREKTGRGQYVDASLFEAAIAFSIWDISEYWGTGRIPTPLGTANRFSAPYQAVRASDAFFVMGANNNKLWQTLCEVLERPDLLADARFGKIADRLLNRVALIEELEKSFAARTAANWIEILLAAGIPAGPILNYAQALASDHAKAREAVMEFEHPVEGTVKSIGFPVKLSETKQRVRLPPPLLGQHNDEILRELGVDDKTREQLRAEGAAP
ncbi:MAG TPA: CoA transferase [Micropepsaceae bacterium]|jgi:formyl-CoA transferase|nr:CoA transferase [Micropepsaceae bacterium]